MKRSLLLASLLVASLAACTDAQRADTFSIGSHFQITLYAYNGTVIKQWQSQGKVLPEEGSDGWKFTDHNGKLVRISGTVDIEQID
jgi:hypothetical protein